MNAASGKEKKRKQHRRRRGKTVKTKKPTQKYKTQEATNRSSMNICYRSLWTTKDKEQWTYKPQTRKRITSWQCHSSAYKCDRWLQVVFFIHFLKKKKKSIHTHRMWETGQWPWADVIAAGTYCLKRETWESARTAALKSHREKKCLCCHTGGHYCSQGFSTVHGQTDL